MPIMAFQLTATIKCIQRNCVRIGSSCHGMLMLSSRARAPEHSYNV